MIVIGGFFVCLIAPLRDSICFANEIQAAELVSILNLSRNFIQNGELRIMYASTSTRPQEWVDKWMEEQKQQIMPNLPKVEYDQQLKDLFIVASRVHLKREELEEQNIAFEISSAPDLKTHRYRIVRLDRRPLDYLSYEDQFLHVGQLNIITYDGQLQVHETDYRGITPYISLYNEPRLDLLPFHLFGRPLLEIPDDAAISLEPKNMNGTTLYELRLQKMDRGSTVLYKWLIDPSKGFAVLKEEQFEGETLRSSWEYSQFEEISDNFFYPTEITMKSYMPGGRKINIHITILEKAFNVQFPPDFFAVRPTSHISQRVDPRSEIVPRQIEQPSKPAELQENLLMMCGPLSLQYVLQHLGIKTDIKELKELTDFKKDVGTSMLGLANAARKKGLNPEGLLIKSKTLDGFNLPAIVRIDQNHFIVVNGISKGEVKIFDPASDQKVFSIKEFKQRWDGYLMTFVPTSASASRSAEGPKIQVQDAEYDLGQVRVGQSAGHIFTIANVGTAPLEILKVESSCSCTTALLSDPTILPGKTLQLKVEVKPPKAEDYFEQFIRLRTNDPTQPIFELKVKAVAYLPIQSMPGRLYFGKIPFGTPATRKVELEYSSKATRILGIRTSSDLVQARLLDENHRLEVQVKPQRIGEIDEKVFIDGMDGDENLTLEIPVQGEVTGDFEISPKIVFFGKVNPNNKGNELSREVIITATGNQPLKVLSAESQSGQISTEIIPIEAGRKYKIRISLRTTGQTGAILKDVVKIHTNSQLQENLEIPVYAYMTRGE